ncbi:hypothetical protein KKG45_13305 [bacterium]|nr:hypothetical protein [bacterium]MBU1074218.1 hypothetical protein [bacterium]MBU1676749.1 hypothetical protein [bacterium]
MRHVFPAVFAALVLASIWPVVAAAAENEAPAPSYTGTWVRNETLSDDPAQVMGARTDMPGGMRVGMGRGGMGGGMGRGGRGGGKAEAMDDIRTDDPQAVVKPPAMMQGLERLEIFHEGDEFAVTDDMDILQSLYTDGRRIERWTPMGQVFETATVTGDGIVVRSEGKDGRDRTVTYTLDTEGRRLTVVHEFKPPRRDETVALRMVYDRAE